MLLEFAKGYVTVRKETTDVKKLRTESAFLYALKNALRDKGFDVVKKLAYKDGHLVDDYLYYIRDRKKRWYIFDALHAVRNCAEVFDRGDEVVLALAGGMVK